jgi:hypothetical protein
MLVLGDIIELAKRRQRNASMSSTNEATPPQLSSPSRGGVPAASAPTSIKGSMECLSGIPETLPFHPPTHLSPSKGHRRINSASGSIILGTCATCKTPYYRVKKYCTHCGSKLEQREGQSSPTSSISTTFSEQVHRSSILDKGLESPPARPITVQRSASSLTSGQLNSLKARSSESDNVISLKECLNASSTATFTIKVKVCLLIRVKKHLQESNEQI